MSCDPLDSPDWVNRVSLSQVKDGTDGENTSLTVFRSQKSKSIEVRNRVSGIINQPEENMMSL